MDSHESQRIEFVDALLTALGLKSITVMPATTEEPVASLGETGIHGRSYFCGENREVLLEVFAGDPELGTLRALHAAVQRRAGDGHDGARSIATALAEASAEHPGATLEEFVRAAREEQQRSVDF